MIKREKAINKHKDILFSENKINLLKLFNFIDCENNEYIDRDNLGEYFPNSEMIALLYGNYKSKGRIKFCDFIRMTVPMEYNVELVGAYEDEVVDLAILEKMIRIFKLISENEK